MAMAPIKRYMLLVEGDCLYTKSEAQPSSIILPS